MPEKCLSCGESAVVEEEVDGGQVQRICVECGTVAAGVRPENATHSNTLKIECIPFLNLKKEEQMCCESCGDFLQLSLQSGVKLCAECQELESGVADDAEQLTSTQPDQQQVPPLNSSSTTCKSCHSSNVGLDVCGVDERLVCKDCGTVAENEALTNDDFEVTSRAYRNSFLTLPKHARNTAVLKGRAAGHDKIAFIYNKLCFPEVIRDEALEMFNRVFEKPTVYFTHITTKEHIAAACVFIVCRQHDMPVSLDHFRKYVEKYKIFLKGRKIVMKTLNINHPSITMSSQVELVLPNCAFNSAIISKVKDILFLCRKAWLTQGRSRQGLIIIAAYYAFISSTSFVSMAKFRQMFKFPNISMLLQSECNSLFLKLASSIPWVVAKHIKPTTVYKYVDDILKYQNSLLQLAFKSDDDHSSSVDLTVPETKNELEVTPKRKKRCKNTAAGHFIAVNKDVLLPSASKKPRREVFRPETHISPMVNLDSPVVLASEFDEAEMASYLLSSEEEAVLRTPKLTFMQ